MGDEEEVCGLGGEETGKGKKIETGVTAGGRYK